MDIIDDLNFLKKKLQNKEFQENRKSFWNNYFEKYETLYKENNIDYRNKFWFCKEQESVVSKKPKHKKTVKPNSNRKRKSTVQHFKNITDENEKLQEEDPSTLSKSDFEIETDVIYPSCSEATNHFIENINSNLCLDITENRVSELNNQEEICDEVITGVTLSDVTMFIEEKVNSDLKFKE